MNGTSDKKGGQTINIGRDAVKSKFTNVGRDMIVVLPPPETVNLSAELAAIRDALAALPTEDQPRMVRALQDAEEEAARPEARKDVVGESIERALKIAEQSGKLADAVEKLQPHVTKVVGWLGENWHKLLGVVGLGL